MDGVSTGTITDDVVGNTGLYTEDSMTEEGGTTTCCCVVDDGVIIGSMTDVGATISGWDVVNGSIRGIDIEMGEEEEDTTGIMISDELGRATGMELEVVNGMDGTALILLVVEIVDSLVVLLTSEIVDETDEMDEAGETGETGETDEIGETDETDEAAKTGGIEGTEDIEELNGILLNGTLIEVIVEDVKMVSIELIATELVVEATIASVLESPRTGVDVVGGTMAVGEDGSLLRVIEDRVFFVDGVASVVLPALVSILEITTEV